jgi:hypothetical protein
VNKTLTLMLGFWLCGCDEPLKTVELVAEPRVLGARVEVQGDPGRAAPAPGESASVRLLVAAPELEPALGFALAACPAAPRNATRGACAGPVFARVLSARAAGATPELDFQVPSELDPQGRILVQGLVCPEASPSSDGRSCEGGGGSIGLQLELELERSDDVNSNPELEADSITFDEQPWPELPLVAGDCTGRGFPEVAPASTHRVGVALDQSDRDALPRPSDLDPAREDLQLSHFVSGGDITRAFETIAWNSQDLQRQVEWQAPREPGLFRIWFVLRDFRGGGAFTARAMCVKP